MAGQQHDFDAVKARLEEIANAVGDDAMPLDKALDLFEEAVGLGLKVSDLIEEDIVVPDLQDAPEGDAETVDAPAPTDAPAPESANAPAGVPESAPPSTAE